MEQDMLESTAALALTLAGYKRYIVGNSIIWARSYDHLKEWAIATQERKTFWTQQYGKLPVDLEGSVVETPTFPMRTTDLVLLGAYN